MNPVLQQDLGKLVLRVVLGVLILFHGIAKLDGGMRHITAAVEAQGLPGVLGYLVLVGEVVAPLMLILGLHARIGGLLVLANMLVAVFLMHMGELDALNRTGGWALELQGMFIAASLAVALLGPGRFSANGR